MVVPSSGSAGGRRVGKKPKHGSAGAEVDREASNNSNNRNSTRGTVRVVVAPSSSSSAAANPIVCSFPGGLPESLQKWRKTTPTIPTTTTTTNEEEEDIPHFQWSKSGANKWLLSGRDSSCLYTSSIPILRSGNTSTNTSTSTSSSSKPTKQVTGASSDTTHQQQQQHSQWAVGIYDKHTGTLTLHPTAADGRILAMHQHVPAYTTAATTATATGTSTRSSSASYRALFEDFGSSKKKRVLKSQEANRVTVLDDDDDNTDDNQHKSSATKTAAAAWNNPLKMSESNRQALAERRAAVSIEGGNATHAAAAAAANTMPADSATAAWRTTFLPKFHAAATNPASIYQAADIAGPAAWDWIQRAVAAAWQQPKFTTDVLWKFTSSSSSSSAATATSTTGAPPTTTWIESVRGLLDTIPMCDHDSTSSDRTNLSATQRASIQHQLACAVLLHHFVRLYRQWNRQRFIPVDGGGSGSKRDHEKRMDSSSSASPLVIRQRFLAAFGTSTSSAVGSGKAGYAMSEANKDSCLVHILILYLVAHGRASGDGGSKGRRSAATSAPAAPLQANNVERLALDLQIDASKTVQLLRQAGCLISRPPINKKQIIATLQVPLTFPVSRKMKRATR